MVAILLCALSHLSQHLVTVLRGLLPVPLLIVYRWHQGNKIVSGPVVWKTVHIEFSVIYFLVSAETLMDLLKCSVTELDGEKMSWWIEVFVFWCTLYVLWRDGLALIKQRETCIECLKNLKERMRGWSIKRRADNWLMILSWDESICSFKPSENSLRDCLAFDVCQAFDLQFL